MITKSKEVFNTDVLKKGTAIRVKSNGRNQSDPFGTSKKTFNCIVKDSSIMNLMVIYVDKEGAAHTADIHIDDVGKTVRNIKLLEALLEPKEESKGIL